LPEEALTFYSGLLSRPVASAMTIEAAVAYFAEAPVRVEQFVERIVDLEPSDQTQLGVANATLGDDAICGSQVWEVPDQIPCPHRCGGQKAKVVRLMPSGDLLVPVFSLVSYMVGIEYEFEIRIYLKKGCSPVPGWAATDADAPMLGWTTWVASPGYAYEADIFFTFQEYDLKLVKF
jgi:type VI secretion system protein ImpH